MHCDFVSLYGSSVLEDAKGPLLDTGKQYCVGAVTLLSFNLYFGNLLPVLPVTSTALRTGIDCMMY